MKCMTCDNEAAAGKALCERCYALASEQRKGRTDAWDNRKNKSPAELHVEEQKLEQLEKKPAGSGEIEEQVVYSTEAPPHASRLLAHICDSLILGVLTSVLFLVMFKILSGSTPMEAMYALQRDPGNLTKLTKFLQQIGICSAVVGFLPMWAYYVAFECSPAHATPAKILLGLSVRSIGGMDAAVSSKRFFVKWAALVVPLALAPFAGGMVGGFLGLLALPILLAAFLATIINPFVVLFSKDRVGIHDMVAKTYVVKDHKVGSMNIVICIVLTVTLAVLYILLSSI